PPPRQRIEHALSARTVRKHPQLVDRLASLLEESPPDLDAWREQAAAGARYTNRGRAGNIRARTLVVHGSDDTVVDPRNAALLAATIPDADLAVLPGAGHLLFWEQPDEFVSAVAGFLEASPARGAAGARAYAMAPR
ncbi:MAG: alpha/beta fold hydrolase, partial [Actinomycetota bacterium]|nr:alpha/beta fold hydrolase [Actinomycetota bacterium]